MATTPICRCRVLYLGSSVPHITKDGLQGIQEPLRDLYPEQGSFSAKGIDSWLSVWSNGLLLENVDESMRQVTRFFNIETLHYCAAVRYVVVPGNNGERVEKFLPLDSPFARHADPNHAPLFACILRRTAGIKVLECHAFICKKEAAANALVRCCFHSYADSMQAKHLEENSYYLENKRSRSMSGLNTLEKVEVWRSNAEAPHVTNGITPGGTLSPSTKLPTENGKTYSSPVGVSSHEDDNYKVWTGIAPTERELLYVDASGTMRSLKSGNNTTRSAQVKVRQMVGPARPPPPPSPSLINGRDSKLKSKSKSKNKKKQKDTQMIPNCSPHLLNGFRPPSAIDAFGVVIPPTHQGLYSGSGLYTERRVRRMGRPPLPGHEEPIYIPSTRPLSPVSSYQPAAFPYEQYFMQYGTAPRSRFPKGESGKKRHHQHEYQPLCPPQLYQNQPYPLERKHNGHENLNSSKENKDDDQDSPCNTGMYKKKGQWKHNGYDNLDNDHEIKDDDQDSPFNTGIYRKKSQGKHNGHDTLNSDIENKDDGRDSPFNTGIYKKKGQWKHNNNDNSNNDQETKDDDQDSPFNTGIYKKKGHLNERAFSYSIRQEHRSRSNSLANLQFFSSGEQGSPGLGGHRTRDEDRKERELAQLVHALDLKENGDKGLYLRGDPDIAPRPESNFMRRKAPAY